MARVGSRDWQLCLLRSHGASLGQGFRVGNFVLAPLHVIDGRFKREARSPLVLHGATSSKQTAEVGRVVGTLPHADCTILEVSSEFEPMPPLDLEPVVKRGDAAEVVFLEPGLGMQATPRRVLTAVDDLVIVASYTYLSASGVAIRLVDAHIIVLRDTVPAGASGAPVRAVASRRIIGLVHGTAQDFRNSAICLSPLPIAAALRRCGP